MTTTNPVNMSVLPTEQCLIEDGSNDLSVAGQFTPASSFVDSYQLCDPNNKCLVVGAGMATAATLLLASEARRLQSEGKYAEAALKYVELGQGFLTIAKDGQKKLALHYYREAMASYEKAFKLYKAAGDALSSAKVASAIVRVALKARLRAYAFIYSDLAVPLYFQAAQTATTKAPKLSIYREANELLRTQAWLVRDGRGGPDADTDALIASYEMEGTLCRKQLVALQQIMSNSPAGRSGKVEYEVAGVCGRLADAYVALRMLDDAAQAYGVQYEVLRNVGSANISHLGEKALEESLALGVRFSITAGDAQSAVSSIRATLKRHIHQAREIAFQTIAKLAHEGAGIGDERLDAAVRRFAGLFDGGAESQGLAILTGERKELSDLFKNRLNRELVLHFHNSVGQALKVGK